VSAQLFSDVAGQGPPASVVVGAVLAVVAEAFAAADVAAFDHNSAAVPAVVFFSSCF